MDKNILMLYKEFLNIKNMGWIKSKRKGSTGIGYTFEQLLNKPEENFPIPDYNNIEIKTGRKYTGRDIHLFCANPDGDTLFPNDRILHYLGYPDKDIANAKIFNMNFDAKNYRKIGIFKVGRIFVNRKEHKVDFIAKKINGNFFKIDTSWSFDMLEHRLNLKLKYMARIIADVKKIDNIEYFKYDKIIFYKLKNFETFISLIEKGYININFNIGVYKSGLKIGKIHDRGVNFSIKEKDINLLFDEIDICL